ncbi:MAG: ECF-type sigma factor [Phycisphaerales bacterium JB052]
MIDQTSFTQALTALDMSRIVAGDTPEELLESIYDELRRIANGYLRQERVNHTLQPTALVHEAYARLADQASVPWSDAAHFRAITARVMRQVLIDHARRHGSLKRGGGDRLRVTLSGQPTPDPTMNLDVLELEEAMIELRGLHERKARVVELIFFGGMTHEEASRVVGVSKKTIESDWYAARAWLGNRLGMGADS